MRVDYDNFHRSICCKCNRYTGDKPVFGKCAAGRSEIYVCARRMLEDRFKPAREDQP